MADVKDLKGKVAVVTGASTGIGRAICVHLAELGIKVVAIARSENKLEQLKNEIEKEKGEMIYFPVSVTDYNGIQNVIEKVIDKWGVIDILINNAGINKGGSLEDMSREDIDDVVDTNLKGMFYCTKFVIPSMIKNKSGYIFNISSVAGLRGCNTNGIYCSTKYGVDGFSSSISKYLAEYRVKVTTIYPGATDTPIWPKDKSNHTYYDKERFTHKQAVEMMMKPEEFAEAVEFMLKTRDTTVFKDVTIANLSEMEMI